MTQKRSQELIEFCIPLPHFYTWNLKWNPTFCVLYVFSKCRWVTLNISLKTSLLSVSLHIVQQLSLEEDTWCFHVSETLSREGRHCAWHSVSLWPTVCRWHWLAMTVHLPQPSQCLEHHLLCLRVSYVGIFRSVLTGVSGHWLLSEDR